MFRLNVGHHWVFSFGKISVVDATHYFLKAKCKYWPFCKFTFVFGKLKAQEHQYAMQNLSSSEQSGSKQFGGGGNT
jgi:hypothetical protein